MTNLFSLKGRYTRSCYFWTSVVLSLLFPIVFTVVLISASSAGYKQETLDLIQLYGQLLAITTIVPQTVKRLHDLDRPGSHFWLLFVPIYGLWLSLVLLCKKGSSGTNRYGPDPLRINYEHYGLSADEENRMVISRHHFPATEQPWIYQKQDGFFKQSAVAVFSGAILALITPTVSEIMQPASSALRSSFISTQLSHTLAQVTNSFMKLLEQFLG